eukprot:scaffold100984_cov77-Attheya_sp.AAC.1
MQRMLLVPPPKSCKNPGQSFTDWFKKQPDIGKNVYGFERERAPTVNEIECTIVQLIATNMILLSPVKMSDSMDKTVIYVSLSFSNNVATCTSDAAWRGIHLVEEAPDSF